MRLMNFTGAVTLAACVVSLAAPSSAQTIGGALSRAQAEDVDLFGRDRAVSVTQRPRPEYEAVGGRVGGFLIFPKVEFAVEANDNIYATAINADSDTIFRVRPEIAIESDWPRHALNGYARGSINRYQDFDTEDYEDSAIGASGRLDIVRGASLSFGADRLDLVEPRSASNTPGFAAEPIEYTQTQAFIGGARTAGRLRLSSRADWREFDYQDGFTLGGAPIDQDDRDRTVVSLTGRADWAVSPATAFFVQATGNDRDYDTASTALVPARDSDGYELLGGVNFELGAVARGEVAAGYISQSFDDPRFNDIDGFGARVQLEWFPTDLTTVTVAGGRTIEDAGIAGANGYLSTAASVRVDHELLRNLILTASATRTHDEYQGVDREDDRTIVSVGGTWLLNRNLGVNLAASRLEQESDGAGRGVDFEVNRLVLSLITQF